MTRGGCTFDAEQGRRLQALLGFKEQFIGKTLAAQVIGTSGTELSRVIYIDRGTHDGVEPGMAVITADGIVGKISRADRGTSQVLLITDPSSGAGVRARLMEWPSSTRALCRCRQKTRSQRARLRSRCRLSWRGSAAVLAALQRCEHRVARGRGRRRGLARRREVAGQDALIDRRSHGRL